MTRIAILFAALLAGCWEPGPSAGITDPCGGLDLFNPHDVPGC